MSLRSALSALPPQHPYQNTPPPSNWEYDVVIPSTTEGLLINIGLGSNDGDSLVLFLGYRKFKDGTEGAAEKANLIRNVGDHFVLVDGVPTAGKSFNEVKDMLLKSSKNQLCFIRFQDRVIRRAIRSCFASAETASASRAISGTSMDVHSEDDLAEPASGACISDFARGLLPSAEHATLNHCKRKETNSLTTTGIARPSQRQKTREENYNPRDVSSSEPNDDRDATRKVEETEILSIIKKQLWVEDEADVEEAMARLYNLLSSDDDDKDKVNSRIALHHGAPIAIYRVMKRFLMKEKVQDVGISIFVKMSYCPSLKSNSEGSADEKEILGIIKKRVWVEDRQDVSDAMNQLCILLGQGDIDRQKRNYLAAFCHGAPLAVYRTMKSNMERLQPDKKIQLIGTKIFANLSHYSTATASGVCYQVLINVGALEVCWRWLVQSQFTATNPELMSEVSKLLGNLMRDKDSTDQVIVETRGDLLSTLVMAMEKHPEDSTLQQSASFALLRSLENRPGGRLFGFTGLVEVVVKAMNKHQDMALINLYGCGVLYHLAKDHNNGNHRRRIREAGGMEAVAAAMHIHRDNEGVKSGAEKAMRVLLA